ncbi:cytochrome c oxidase assembly protein [Microbacterium lushaniae]|uniref:Cytochrome c oxidase assembly protein n=1 Tax=Microbacterium lushaniae TaxID=2614639 RepID=A0A5J6L2P4_9MICO|nr:cytochrome c oxidase assembly protein [Microbacterium lushaniae]QEW02853.1 cytochrome c oxidase assembly protein [Microbacterium lushaniae]
MTAQGTGGHAHAGDAGGFLDGLVLAVAALAIVMYVAAVVVSHRRGRGWPRARVVAWIAGVTLGAAAVTGPLAATAHDDYVAHMGTHLLAGMLAPVLLVLAAPVTLALRTLSVTPARRLSALLLSPAARVISHPVTAALLSAGGLWAIYLTPVFEAMSDPLVHVLVHAHLLAAGFLFTSAVIGRDPAPHRPSRPVVAVVLVLAIASHAILAKYLYAQPPASVPLAEAEAGAQLMYYAGAWVEAALIVVFCADWYRAAGRDLRVGGQPVSTSSAK